MLKKIVYYLLYLILQALAHLLRLFSINFGRLFARLLGNFIFYFVPLRRKEVISRLKETFRDRSELELWRLAKNVYVQFLTSMTELIYFPKLTAEEIDDMVEIKGLEMVKKLSAEKRGAVFVSGHFGNWELMGAALTKYIPVNFLVGRQHNVKADDLLNMYRVGKGIKIIPLEMALKNVIKALRAGEIVCMLSDQDAHERGVFVDFLGRPSSTPKGPAAFALKTKLPLVTGFIVRENGRFTIYFDEIPAPPDGVSDEEAIKIYTQRYTKKLEEFVLKYPDHWFWLHRRWKSKPSDEAHSKKTIL